MLVKDRDLNQDVFENVCIALEEMGLGDLEVAIIPGCKIGDGGGDEYAPCIKVTYGEGTFGNKMEELDKWFSIDLFMMFFEGRKNYLKLTADERALITMHPQMWEKEFLAGNTSK